MEKLTPEEVRVVACLIEKELATPDYYPMTHNALVAACNQLSNRDPVVAYDDNTVRLALNSLRAKGLARALHIHGARAPKYRHVLDEALGLDRPALALLCVLSLRGPQTPGELRARSERLFGFASRSSVEEMLHSLAERGIPLARQELGPGQKEVRFVHLLGAADEEPSRLVPRAAADSPPTPRHGDDRVAALEARVEALEGLVAELREAAGLGDD
ncbi:MAG: YceH family protein [Acidimicrobiia bacterium]